MVATSTIKTKNPECVSELQEGRCGPPELDLCLAARPGPAGEEENAVDEDALTRRLATTLEECLSRAKATTLRCSAVLAPERLTRRVARHVLRQVASEPCGLRGCVLYVELDEGAVGGGIRPLERLACDAAVVPTVELTLVLKRDRGGVGGGWLGLRRLLGAAWSLAPAFRPAVRLSPGFRLVKRKLYSSAPAVVEEC
ncbi:hypothetical protein NHX12_014360 [Muraenolepis orangiensis]|uniref:DNA damage-inducible transcript 4-like protein n=1 Tax=Muraenolepis orangiensis TaxID=630683 RepID=A0A9Q0I6R7_9TELE|nr:hypothetical protein NHX12_014360 [Muraenolepis orangiensis]